MTTSTGIGRSRRARLAGAGLTAGLAALRGLTAGDAAGIAALAALDVVDGRAVGVASGEGSAGAGLALGIDPSYAREPHVTPGVG